MNPMQLSLAICIKRLKVLVSVLSINLLKLINQFITNYSII